MSNNLFLKSNGSTALNATEDLNSSVLAKSLHSLIENKVDVKLEGGKGEASSWGKSGKNKRPSKKVDAELEGGKKKRASKKG